MPEKALPITQGKTDSLDDWGTTNSRFVNWAIDNDGNVHQRPGIAEIAGLSTRTSGVSQYVIGSYVWRSPVDLQTYLVYVRADRFIRALNVATLATSDLTNAPDPTTYLDGASTRAIFTENTVHLVIAGGGQLQSWTGAGFSARLDPVGTWSPTTNQPPIAATHGTFLGNYIIANNYTSGSYGQFLWSNLGDGNDGTWNPLNFNTADASPDRVTGVYSSLQELYVFGERTVQVYGLSSDPYLPFASACALSVGCGAPYSPILLENAFAWFDDRRRFVVSDGRSYDVISAPVEKTVRDIATVSDCFGFRVQMTYYDVLVWVFPTAQVCLTYDVRKKVWGTWESLGLLGETINPRIGSYSYWAGNNMAYVGDSLYENVFVLDSAATEDVGPKPIGADMILNRDDNGMGAFKATSHVDLFLKRGQSASGGTLEIATRDDDTSWQPYHQVAIGMPGDYVSNVRWYPGGVYQRRQYRIRYSGSGDVALSKVVERFDVRSR